MKTLWTYLRPIFCVGTLAASLYFAYYSDWELAKYLLGVSILCRMKCNRNGGAQ